VTDQPTSGSSPRIARVFISYSRSDREFVDRVERALQDRGFAAWVDRREIGDFEDWWRRIETLIAGADTIVFVLSPDAISSEVALKEVAFAASLNKRFAPIVCRPVDDRAVPTAIARINRIDFVGKPFEATVEQLTKALATDIEWIRKHTTFGEAALRWHGAGRPGPSGLMIRPPLLGEAEAWIGLRPREAPEPSEMLQSFVMASREAFDQEEAVKQAYIDRALVSQVNLLAQLAEVELIRGNPNTALRLGIHAAGRGLDLQKRTSDTLHASAALASILSQIGWRLRLGSDQGELTSVAFSSDGARIVVAASDRTARIWEIASAQEVAVLRGHMHVYCAAFSPDGSRVVTASTDKTVRIWDAFTGKEITVLLGHWNAVRCAAFSPDGSRVVSGSEDGTVHVWDAATGREIGMTRRWGHGVTSCAFSPDGTRVVTSGLEGIAQVLDAFSSELREIVTLRGHQSPVVANAAFNSAGTRIVTAGWDNTARVWDATTGEELVVLRGPDGKGGVRFAAFSPEGLRVVTANSDQTARILNVASGQEMAVLRGHEKEVTCATFSPDGSQIATASQDGTVRLWDAVAAKELHGHEKVTTSAAFSPDGARIVTSSYDNTARIWDAATAREISVLCGHEEEVHSAAFSPDGSRIVTASSDRTARIWEVAAGSEILLLRGHEKDVYCAGFSPDGSRIVTGSLDGTSRIWDAATGQEIAISRETVVPDDEDFLTRGHAIVQCCVFSPDGTRVVAVDYDQVARIFDAATGEEIAVLEGHTKKIRDVGIDQRGSRIVTASDDCTVRIWDAESAAEIAVLRGLEAFWSARFSPDGSRIVTAAMDHTVRIWEAGSWKQIALLGSEEISRADFSPDGLQVVVGGLSDCSARIWDVRMTALSTQDLIAEGRRRLLGVGKLSRAEMRIAGYPGNTPEIDVCTE
jgi:WD40 repeat protein